MEFDKLKFLRRVLDHLTDDELKEFGTYRESLDEYMDGLDSFPEMINDHMRRACWIPTASARFIEDQTYTVGPYSFVGKEANEMYIGEALHSMTVDEMWGDEGSQLEENEKLNRLPTVERLVRDYLGVPQELKFVEDENDPDFEWIEAVLRYVDTECHNMMFGFVVQMFRDGHKWMEGTDTLFTGGRMPARLMTEVVYPILEFNQYGVYTYEEVHRTIQVAIGESK